MTAEQNKRQGVPADFAAGVPAVQEVVRQLKDKTGIGRGVSSLLRMNQPGGFDCPGCAWPEDSERRKKAEFCENGAKAFADEAVRKTIGEDFFAEHSIAELEERSEQWLNEQGRLAQPMVRKPGATHYTPITWFAACELIARQLENLDDPNQAAFYTSGRASNEAAFLWQLLARSYGTNNMPDCSNLCHESSGTALSEVIGSGKGTVRLSDFDYADAIFVLGQNPGSNHPRMLATLEQAKKRGAVIVAINPLDEVGLRNYCNPQTISGLRGQGSALVDLHIPVRINGDVAFLQGVCKALLEAEQERPGQVLDRPFIEQFTAGFDGYEQHIALTTWESIEAGSGVGRALIKKAADVALKSKATICCWAMGLTQHKNAVSNIQEIINFLMLQGNLGKQGAGACPVRGHSNVQGDRTMGIWEKPDPDFLQRLGARFKFEPPVDHGLDTVDTINALHEGRVKVLLALGGNFLSASPDAGFTSSAVRTAQLTVQLSTKLNRSHIVAGETALILPVLARSELDTQVGGAQFVTIENSMGVVTQSRGHLPAASEFLKSEVRAVAEIAEALLGAGGTIKWLELADDYNRIRDDIAAVVDGFEEFNDRLIMEGAIELPHAVRDKREFRNSVGKGLFTVHAIEPHGIPAGHYLMMTIRSHDQFNTTVYSQEDRYRGISGSRMVVFMNPADMKASKLHAGANVVIKSHFRDEERCMEGFDVVPYQIPRGCVATYYPETNPLIPVAHVAAGSNTPAYKSVVVSLTPSG